MTTETQRAKLIKLLGELRDITNSRSTHDMCNELIPLLAEPPTPADVLQMWGEANKAPVVTYEVATAWVDYETSDVPAKPAASCNPMQIFDSYRARINGDIATRAADVIVIPIGSKGDK